MILIGVLSVFRLKLDVQTDVVTLINDGTMARRHQAGVKTDDSGNRREVFLCACQHFIRRVGYRRVRPKDYDMGKH
jgi:hypothetical protein